MTSSLRRWARAIVLSALAASGGAASAQALVVRDDRGVDVALAASPQRIVSLLPSLTESVCALGACARLVGVDRFSNWPDSVRALLKLGGLEDALVERVVALKPDLVLAAPSARAIERFEGLGLKVLVLESRDRADVKRTLSMLARVLEAAPQAAAVWSKIERDERLAVERVPAHWRGRRVYFEVDATPYAAGAGSFIGETLAQLGLANIVPNELGPFPKLNPEFVVRAQPELVIAQNANLAEMPKRPGWAGLRALRSGAVCGFEPAAYELLIRPGPRMGEAAQSLATCLAALPAPNGALR
ncbi:MAG TPA: helical backbone metal receptor [Burkholderiaceae bacterium]|nr:helical backbone metal receptor [Burkholderiaceae bacterium]